MSVQLILTFASIAALQEYLAGNPGAASGATTAHTSRTAAAGKGGAPETKEETSVKPELKFDDVKAKLMAYNKKVDKDTFGKTMAKLECKSIKDVEAKPAIWAELVDICDKAPA